MSLKIGNVTPEKIFCTTASGEVAIKKVYVGTTLIWKDDFEDVRSFSLQIPSSVLDAIYETLDSLNYKRTEGATDDVLVKISSSKYSLVIKDSDLDTKGGINLTGRGNIIFDAKIYPKGYRIPFRQNDTVTLELLSPKINREFTNLERSFHYFFVQGDRRYDSAKARIFGKSGYTISLMAGNGDGPWEVSEDGELELTLYPGSYQLYANNLPKGETIMTLQQDAVSRSYSLKVFSVTLA